MSVWERVIRHGCTIAVCGERKGVWARCRTRMHVIFCFSPSHYVSSMGLLHQIRGDIFSQLCFFLPIGRWSCCSISLFHLGEPCAKSLRLNVAAFSNTVVSDFPASMPECCTRWEIPFTCSRPGWYLRALLCVGIALQFCRSATNLPKARSLWPGYCVP